jgi:1,4-alpha-glucan branching enzyme
LPPTAFVAFLQNHDQVGNRAFGERLSRLTSADALWAALAILLLSPSPPLLFMGEEFAAANPFLFFCDFEPRLAAGVARGRCEEFGRFLRFGDPGNAAHIPDPTAASTFLRSKLDWRSLAHPPHSDWLARYRELLALRRREVVPLIPEVDLHGRSWRIEQDQGLFVRWRLMDDRTLALYANLGDRRTLELPEETNRRIIFATANDPRALPPWSTTFAVIGAA